MSKTEFKPSLSLIDATMLVAGSMIGSGIFIVTADISRQTGSAGWLIVVWALTGFMTLTAALSYGELSSMFPKAGGQYIYLREAYNPLVSFLYGWSFFTVIQTATIAAVGVAFAKFTAYLLPFFSEERVLLDTGVVQISSAQLLSIGVITLLTFINTRGVSNAKWVQTIITLAKLLSLALLVTFGLYALKPEIWNANWNSSSAWDLQRLNVDGSIEAYTRIAAFGAIAAAMVGSIFSSDSWHNVAFIAGEVKNPKRNIGLSLALGTILVTILYLLTNLMYTGVLTLPEMAAAPQDRIAVVASQVIFGPSGTAIIAIMIMVSTFGCNNGLILSGARVYYSMSLQGVFFRKVGQLNKRAVPEIALWMQGVIASLWCLSGRYGDLLDMISFVVVLFYMLTIAGIFVLRKKRPDHPRPYKAFGYPFLPALYMLMGTAFCLLLIVYRPQYTWPGLLITLAGIPVYYTITRLRPGSRHPVN